MKRVCKGFWREKIQQPGKWTRATWEYFLLQTQNGASGQYSKDPGPREVLGTCHFLKEDQEIATQACIQPTVGSNKCPLNTYCQPSTVLCSALYVIPHNHHNDFARMEVASTFYSRENYGSGRLRNLSRGSAPALSNSRALGSFHTPWQPSATSWLSTPPSSRPSAPEGWTPLDPTQTWSTCEDSEQLLVESELVCGEIMILLETRNLILLKAKSHLWQSPGKLSL